MEKRIVVYITNRVRRVPGGFQEMILEPLTERGFEVVWAADFSTLKVPLSSIGCETLQTGSRSNPFNPKNIKAYFTVLNFLVKNRKRIEAVFCCTPIGGLIGRLAGHRAKISKIIYQAHGFLFFKGGPKLGWLYRIEEKVLAHYTNYLITINQEDYESSKKFRLRKGGKIFRVHGSGPHLNFETLTFEEKEKEKAKRNLAGKKVLISIGELNKNKNVLTTVKAFECVKVPNSVLLVCGEGPETPKIKKYIERHSLQNRIRLLGYRLDVSDLLKLSDAYISTSKREGLSRTVCESLALGLPCIVSDKRGLKDCITDNACGFLVNCNSVRSVTRGIDECFKLVLDDTIIKNNQRSVEKFDAKNVLNEMLSVYEEIF